MFLERYEESGLYRLFYPGGSFRLVVFVVFYELSIQQSQGEGKRGGDVVPLSEIYYAPTPEVTMDILT